MTPPKNDPDSSAEAQKAAGGSIPERELDVARAREEFAATLDELENRLNPKNQFRRARTAVTKRVSDDPKVLAAAAAGAAGLAAAVAGVARLASRGSRR
ncbi:hypothetical protein GCM10025867_04740 [Frondihabitans sucicola]|uniref:DUF3618 domain-containing protein n=1 Tax=Frondihabitans sucicola TaxID=1268041 RepID=A0ABN6XXX9_9MICO|nr:DUF3618 domain-containing protein [Frondihabitans sucicola]BDZ48233.1 hypothetical protein GCM10025867_04740 [Frondihabitans sucicola]